MNRFFLTREQHSKNLQKGVCDSWHTRHLYTMEILFRFVEYNVLNFNELRLCCPMFFEGWLALFSIPFWNRAATLKVEKKVLDLGSGSQEGLLTSC